MIDKRKEPRGRAKPKAKRKSALLLERLLNDAPVTFTTRFIEEPQLLFGEQKKCEDPKTGLTLFGPLGAESRGRGAIRVGIVGTGDTVQLVRSWLDKGKDEVLPGRNRRGKAYNPIASPKYPGFSVAFNCELDAPESLEEVIQTSAIELALKNDSPSERISAVLKLVCNAIEILTEKEPAPDVIICAMSNDVDQLCGPQAALGRRPAMSAEERALHRMRRQAEKAGQLLMELVSADADDDDDTHNHWNFHNALKTRAMQYHIPTQLVWEGTLTGERSTQDAATIAWNFFTALYYKAGNVPWGLATVTPGTCFIGVSFYRESSHPEALTKTSLAQVFSPAGEGLVLKGEPVVWDDSRDKKPHLSSDGAKSLVERAIKLYTRHSQHPPSRVVVHKTSRFWLEELDGFKQGLGHVASYDFLALERRGIRFFRLGAEPPLRGTVVHLARRNYLIYTHGYVPFLRCYPGMRIPHPLEVLEHHGDSSADKVCSEILALTKMNWNSCSFAGGDPITLAFSRQVGRILTELPNGEPLESKYRFFM